MLVWKPHWRDVLALLFSPDGSQLVSTNSRVLLFSDGVTGKEIQRKRSDTSEPYLVALAFSPDGKWLASGESDCVTLHSMDGSASVDLLGWNPGTKVDRFGTVTDIAFSPDGTMIAACGMSDFPISTDVLLWTAHKPRSRRDHRRWIGKDSGIRGLHGIWKLAFSPDGKHLACLDENTALLFALRPKPHRVHTYGHFGGDHATLNFSPDGTQLLYSAGRSLLIANLAQPTSDIRVLSERGDIRAAKFTPDGRFLLTVVAKKVKVRDTTTWKEVKTYEWGSGNPVVLAVAPDGSRAAVGTKTGHIVMWDLDL